MEEHRRQHNNSGTHTCHGHSDAVFRYDAPRTKNVDFRSIRFAFVQQWSLSAWILSVRTRREQKKKNGFKFNFDSETLLTKQYLSRLIVAFDLRKQRFYSFVLRNVREKKSKKSFFDATRLRGSLVLWWNQSIFLQSNAEDTTTACKRRCKFTRSFRRRILFGGDLRVCVFYFLLLKTIDEFERKLKITARHTSLLFDNTWTRDTLLRIYITQFLFWTRVRCGSPPVRHTK